MVFEDTWHHLAFLHLEYLIFKETATSSVKRLSIEKIFWAITVYGLL